MSKADVGNEVKRALAIESLIEERAEHALIKQIHEAVSDGVIKEPFTAHDIEDWVEKYNICQGDGTKYPREYAARLLSQSYIGTQNTTNRNRKCLDRRMNEDGLYEYWFI